MCKSSVSSCGAAEIGFDGLGLDKMHQLYEKFYYGEYNRLLRIPRLKHAHYSTFSQKL